MKLSRSLADGRVFDMPPQPVQRYQVEKIESRYAIWRFNHKCQMISAGRILRIEVLAPAVVHCSPDGWRTVLDIHTRDTGLGLHLANLPTSQLTPGTRLSFTFRWPLVERWEGVDFVVTVAAPSVSPPGSDS